AWQVQYPPPFEGISETRPVRNDDRAGKVRMCELLVVDGMFAVCRLGGDTSLPAWATAGRFFSITRTADELSVVCPQEAVPEGIVCERDWRCLRVAGTMP